MPPVNALSRREGEHYTFEEVTTFRFPQDKNAQLWAGSPAPQFLRISWG